MLVAMPKAKAATPARPSGKAKASARKAPAKNDKSASALELVEAEERAENNRPQAKRLRRRNTEETIAKCIRDNFGGWDASQTDHYMVDGMSLREELLRDRRLANASDESAPKFGKRYYELKRERFSPQSAPSKRLKVQDESQPLHPELEKGLIGLNQHVRRYDHILHFLERGALVNQLSLVVLFKHTLKVNPKAGKDSLQFLMSVLLYCCRHGIPKVFRHEWEQIRGHMGETLNRSWLSFKSSGLSAQVWWAGVKHTAKLILEEERVEQLVGLKAEDDWAKVEESLATVVHESIVGKALFGAAFAKLLRGKTTDLITTQVAKLLLGAVSQSALDENREGFLRLMKALDRDAMEPQPPREVAIRYRRALVMAKVTSAFDEYSIKVDALVRGAAVDSGALPPMFCEDSLVPKLQENATLQVDAAILVGNMSARRAAAELMKGKVHSGTVIQEMLQEQRSLLLQLDRSFRLEIDFWSSVSGDRAEQRLLDEVIAVMPKPDLPKTTAEVLDALAKLGQMKLLEFAGVALQSTFRSVISIVEAIHCGKAPGFDGSNMSSFMTSIMGAAALFCKFEEPASEEAPATIIYGKDAAAKALREVEGAGGGGRDHPIVGDGHPRAIPMACGWHSHR